MLWVLLSLLTAFSLATRDLFGKKGMQGVNEYAAAWALRLFGGLFVLPLVLLSPMPALDATFFWVLLIGGLTNAATSVLYFKAIKISPLSLTVPMITFTPLFMLATSPLILGEFPSLSGIAGMALIVAGAYTLHMKRGKRGLLAPFRSIVDEKGPLLMLLVALIWSITANLDKIGVGHSSPVFYVMAFNLFIAAVLTPFMYASTKGSLRDIPGSIRFLVPMGLCSAVLLVSQMHAIMMTLTAYVIAVKRLAVLFAVIYGFIFFKEKNVKQCVIGTLMMIAGVWMMTLL